MMTKKFKKFSLNNKADLDNLKEDFWFCFEARLNAALESGAISEEDLEERPMTVARCVLRLTGENVTPRSNRGIAMLENLRHFV